MRKRCASTKLVCWRCVLFTLGFPVEHVVWERAPLFSHITHLLGL